MNTEKKTPEEQKASETNLPASEKVSDPMVAGAAEPDINKPEPANMEIHHHGHVHHKSKWKEYLFQFFMLFLAVFCGFLAEYQLEHMIEHNREEQFIQSFIEDVERDTLAFNFQIGVREKKERWIDSLITLFKSTNRNNYLADIYFFTQTIQRGSAFNYNDRTIIQLRNSGGMRLIRNKGASDSITLYDSRIRGIQYFEAAEVNTQRDYRLLVGQLFDVAVVQSMLNNNFPIRPLGSPKLLTEDAGLINQLCMQAHYLKTQNRQILNDLGRAKIRALGIRRFLKNEYHMN